MNKGKLRTGKCKYTEIIQQGIQSCQCHPYLQDKFKYQKAYPLSFSIREKGKQSNQPRPVLPLPQVTGCSMTRMPAFLSHSSPDNVSAIASWPRHNICRRNAIQDRHKVAPQSYKARRSTMRRGIENHTTQEKYITCPS